VQQQAKPSDMGRRPRFN